MATFSFDWLISHRLTQRFDPNWLGTFCAKSKQITAYCFKFLHSFFRSANFLCDISSGKKLIMTWCCEDFRMSDFMSQHFEKKIRQNLILVVLKSYKSFISFLSKVQWTSPAFIFLKYECVMLEIWAWWAERAKGQRIYFWIDFLYRCSDN